MDQANLYRVAVFRVYCGNTNVSLDNCSADADDQPKAKGAISRAKRPLVHI